MRNLPPSLLYLNTKIAFAVIFLGLMVAIKYVRMQDITKIWLVGLVIAGSMILAYLKDRDRRQ